jgi:hypothetical protein
MGEASDGEMPSGEMTGSEAGAMDETSGGGMPRGEMTGSGVGAMGEVSGGEMPSGEMTEVESVGSSLGAIELPGLWRLTISPVSR